MKAIMRGFVGRRGRRSPARFGLLAGAALLAMTAAAPRAEAHGGGWDAVGGFVAGTFFGAALRPPVVVRAYPPPPPVYAPAVYAPAPYAYYGGPPAVVVYPPRRCGHRHGWYRRW